MAKLCINCAKHARCVSLGWMSPSGFWFADQVVIRPHPGCELHDIGGTEVMQFLGINMENPDEPAPAVEPDRKAAE